MADCSSNQQCGTQTGRTEAEPDLAMTATLNRIKRKLLVMSGKGGVGKTSVSVNLALILAQKGLKVGLMDIDIHGPDIPRMLGLYKKPFVNRFG